MSEKVPNNDVPKVTEKEIADLLKKSEVASRQDDIRKLVEQLNGLDPLERQAAMKLFNKKRDERVALNNSCNEFMKGAGGRLPEAMASVVNTILFGENFADAYYAQNLQKEEGGFSMDLSLDAGGYTTGAGRLFVNQSDPEEVSLAIVDSRSSQTIKNEYMGRISQLLTSPNFAKKQENIAMLTRFSRKQLKLDEEGIGELPLSFVVRKADDAGGNKVDLVVSATADNKTEEIGTIKMKRDSSDGGLCGVAWNNDGINRIRKTQK